MEKKPKKKTQVLAHSRRQRENDSFTDIAQALPIHENAKDLDKASILRLAIHYLKLRDLIKDGNENMEEEGEGEGEGEEATTTGDIGGGVGDEVVTKVEETAASPEELLFDEPTTQTELTIADFLPNFSKDVVQALDGFLMVVSRDGRVLFSSESIANYLGLRQVDVIGVNVQDIIHPQDCTEVVRIFQSQGHDSEQVFDDKEPLRRKFVVRMRCAFTPSVRCITRCSNFKPIYCSCFLKFGKSGGQKGQFLGMVVFCKLATVSKIKEMVVGTFFKTKHSLDLSYTNVDTRIRWILGYDPSEMTGLKAYQYFHPQDLGVTSSCHMNLLSRGVSHSPCYRFLTRWGDWVWCRSKSLMVFNKNSNMPEGIIIYTWVVRVEEEDDRMLAINKGEDGEQQRKKYDSFSSSVSSPGGNLDVTALANPFGSSEENDSPPTPPSLPTPSPQEAVIPELPYSPPLSAESSPRKDLTRNCGAGGMEVSNPPMSMGISSSPINVGVTSPPMGIGVSSPPIVTGPQMGMGISSPPMGVGVSSPPMGVGVSSPPMGVGVSSPPMGVGVSSPPMGVGVSSPPMGVGISSPPMGVGVSSPPMGVGVSSPPMGVGISSPPMGVGVSSPPMGVGISSPPMGVGISSPPMGVGVSSPPMGISSPPMGVDGALTTSSDPYMHQGFTSDVADQAFLFDQSLPINMSFMPSPPYTPYANHTPGPPNPAGMSMTPQCSKNFSSPYNGNTSPQSYKSSFEESYSPPYSTSTATPLYDHTMQNSTPSQPQVLPNCIVQQQQATPTNHTSSMMSSGMFVANSAVSGHVMTPGGHMTNDMSNQGDPNQSVKLHATFIPNGNSTSSLAGFSENIPNPDGPNMMDVFSLSETEFAQKNIPSLALAPPHVRQSVIHTARQRYSSSIPVGHVGSGGVASGHVIEHGADTKASDSISQWSQWLKGSAPAPVC